MVTVITARTVGPPTWSRGRNVSHYGGASDKADSATEGAQPYASTWYSTIQDFRGTTYRRERDGLVHAETLALARSEQARTRAAERMAANQMPGTSDDRLGYWVEVLAVNIRDGDTRSDIRQRCAAKFRAAVGPTISAENEAIDKLLGDRLIAVFRQEGTDLATPPAQTFWPGVNPGPAAYSLGGGAWLSERANLVVGVTQPDPLDTTEFLRLVNVDLYDLLDNMLPGWATFGWGVDPGTGFVLDVSQLDFGALGT
jgi:hypothetical protein